MVIFAEQKFTEIPVPRICVENATTDDGYFKLLSETILHDCGERRRLLVEALWLIKISC